MKGLSEEIKREQERLLQLQNQLLAQQATCQHKWGEAKFDPEEYHDPMATGEYVSENGFPPRPVFTYVKKQRDRWSRCCEKCELTQYSYEQTPVSYAPKF